MRRLKVTSMHSGCPPSRIVKQHPTVTPRPTQCASWSLALRPSHLLPAGVLAGGLDVVTHVAVARLGGAALAASGTAAASALGLALLALLPAAAVLGAAAGVQAVVAVLHPLLVTGAKLALSWAGARQQVAAAA